MPDIDRIEYGLRKIAVREWLGYVWVCLADEPPSFEDTVMQEIVDRLGDVESIDHYADRRPEPGPPNRLRRQGQLEAHHRELHGVLPLRHHPPGTDRGAARVRRRLRRAVLRRPRRRIRRGGQGFHRRRLRGPRPHPRCDRGSGSPLLRDHRAAAGIRQPGARPRHRAPHVPDGRRPHRRRMRLAVPAPTSSSPGAT